MTEWLMRKGVLGLKAVGGKGTEGRANDRWGPVRAAMVSGAGMGKKGDLGQACVPSSP